MIVSAYNTTVLQGYKIGEIRQKVEALIAREGSGESFRFKEHPRGEANVRIIELLPSPHDIQPFGHPLTVTMGDYEYLVIDIRNFSRKAMNGEIAITSQLDYTTLVNRAFAELAAKHDQQNLLSIGSLHVTLFVRWIADAIGRRLGLPVENQVLLTILTGFYYVCQFLDFGDTLDDRERVKIAQIVSKATFIPVEDILRVLDGIERPVQNTAYDYIELLEKHGNSVRFEQLNIGLLYSILYMGSWFGANKNELISLAVEHPPTFIGMVLSAIDERGYRKTVIGELLKVYDKKNEGEAMQKIFWHLPMSS